MSRTRARLAGLVVLVAAVTSGAATSGFLLTREIRRPAAAQQLAPSLPASLASAVAGATAAPAGTPAPGPAPSARADAVAAALTPLVADPALGGRLLARVIDAESGALLYDRDGVTPAVPASTAKLLTAAAVLAVRAPTDRITTRVVSGGGGAVVLVGGGDPTLTAAAAGQQPAYPQAARIADLAQQLQSAGTVVTSIVVDGELFAGPAVSPDWDPSDVPTSYAAPITALMVDGGRAAPADAVRSAAPELAAGRALAAALGNPALPVARGVAPIGAQPLAAVESAPISTLVEQMLQDSDNVLAECLARQVALARGLPASFAGAATATRDVLAAHGVPVDGDLRDGSGLAPTDRISAATLTALLHFVVAGDVPAIRDLLAGLPVAAWSGTLVDRYLRGSANADGAGVVRAKTGTLTGVSSLAGLVHDRDGRLLAFALLADQVPPGWAATRAAEAALDAIAARLADCGCS